MPALTNSREMILEAAEALVVENGARHMTLDAVAVKARVSKGGILYHFPTKDAFLRAMLDRYRQQVDETWKQKGRGLKEEPRREIKAFILSRADRDPQRDPVGSALLAAVAHDPKLLQPARDDFRKRLAKFMRSGLSFKRAAVIYFAVHGLVFSELLSLSSLNPKERREFVEELLRLADE
jgi:AcrR family transcriptional regulator